MQCKSFVESDNAMHSILFPSSTPATHDDIATGAARHRAALEAEPEHACFVQVVDQMTGEIAGGAKWYFYPTDAGRQERLLVGERAGTGEKRELAQSVLDEFHGRRFERMKGPHARMLSPNSICFFPLYLALA